VTNADFDTPIYINAFVEDQNGVRYATARSVTVCRALGREAIEDEFTPILRFLVASDVHYTDAVGEQDQKFEAMLDGAYDYADGHEKYPALDGAFIAGDIAHRGTETSLNRFFTDFYRWTRDGTEAQAVLGNHEFSPAANRPYAVSRYLAASGYETPDRHIVIAGYHFILMSPSHYEGFDDAKIAWLESELAAAAADDPSGRKPIFVFQHHPAFDTVYGSEDEWGVKNLNPVFAAYPQVVDFSGHSHYPINDPRSVWQGTFTAFNTGSCREWGMDIAGVSSKTHFVSDDKGGWTLNESPANYLFDPGKYYIVEVNAASRILVRAFDIGTGAEVIEPIFLSSVGDPAKFEYTDARADGEEPPRFAPDAAVTTLSLSGGGAEFAFPRAVSGGYVQNYRCEVRSGETLVQTVYRLDCGFLFPAPATLTLPLSGLAPDTEYVVSIVPVTSWENEGEPLVFSFTTPELPVRVFSASFGEGGAATDAVSGETLTKRGDPSTVLDGDEYYAVFDGDDAFEFYGIDDYYPHLTGSFTFETYLCMDAVPASDYVSPFSNQEGGGFGFEYDSTG
ncbi:MAG: metallophosphoesterase, partial [Clostridia bacterium]|nr:metallophosphoesterase [Clostridia bacterium]